MMPNLQAILLGVIAAVFLALGITIFVQHRHIAADQARYEALLKENAIYTAENDRWKNMADQQNKKIADLLTAQEARNAAVLRAVALAKKHADRYARLAARIAKQKTVAANINDDCVAAQGIKQFYFDHQP